jgi:hypothetical protein
MDTKAAFEKWYMGLCSCLDDKKKMFETDELGYTDVLTWTAFAGYKAGIAARNEELASHGIRIKGKTE